jgi:phosphatidylserine synthase 2
MSTRRRRRSSKKTAGSSGRKKSNSSSFSFSSPSTSSHGAYGGSPVNPLDCNSSTFIQNLEKYKNQDNQLIADVTISWMYEPHTLILISVVVGGLIYFAFSSEYRSVDTMFNIRLGLGVAVGFVIALGLMVFPSGPFIRPHPVFWRGAYGLAVCYAVFLIVLLFQTKADARKMMTIFGDDLNQPLVERSYAADCTLSWTNVWEQSMDRFVLAHFFGWIFKALIIRDVKICWIISVEWELIEIAFSYMLPNFAECWWDQLFLDVLVANAAGIYFGMKICSYFEARRYHWHGVGEIPTVYGKIERAVLQFTPASWTPNNQWGFTKSVKRFCQINVLILLFHTSELSAFFLKTVLWVPSENIINLGRLWLWIFIASPGWRQVYVYITNPEVKRMGNHALLCSILLSVEWLVVLKFGQGEYPDPMPDKVMYGWIVAGVVYVTVCGILAYKMYTLANNGIKRVKDKNDDDAE